MKRNLLALVLALTITAPAYAGDTTATGTGAGNSTGTGTASNTVNVIAQAGDPNPANTRVHYSGGTYSTPNVGGSYFAGANPCLVGVGAGAAGGPIGFNINIGKSDQGCNRRSDAAAWHALGLDGIAIARMCQEQGNADAFFAMTGLACPGTQGTGRYKDSKGRPAKMAALGNAAKVQVSADEQP